MLLFLAQMLLISSGRTDGHRRLELIGLVLLPIMIAVALFASLEAVARASGPPIVPPLSWLAVPLIAMIEMTEGRLALWQTEPWLTFAGWAVRLWARKCAQIGPASSMSPTEAPAAQEQDHLNDSTGRAGDGEGHAHHRAFAEERQSGGHRDGPEAEAERHFRHTEC